MAYRPKHMVDCERCEGSGKDPTVAGKCYKCKGPGYYDPRYPPNDRIVVGGPAPPGRNASRRQVESYSRGLDARIRDERRITRPAG